MPRKISLQKRVDRNGSSLKIGDKIRVRGIPPDVQHYHDDEELETSTVFERCLGGTFAIHDFDENRVELEVGQVMGRPAYEHSIWLEPEFIELVSQKKKPRLAANKKQTKHKRVLK